MYEREWKEYSIPLLVFPLLVSFSFSFSLSVPMTTASTRDQIDAIIRHALHEDCGTGDITTEATVPPDTQSVATFLAKATGVLAGTQVVERVFHAIDPELRVEWTCQDGARVCGGTSLGSVTGRVRSILVGERLALNILQRMSGIATRTSEYVQAVGSHPARILDTRKTAPGLRVLDKWAVVIGGGMNHRFGLYDMVLIKDNHIEAAGGIVPAIHAVHDYLQRKGLQMEIEVEARTLEEVRAVVNLPPGSVNRILLDNMTDRLEDGSVRVDRLAEAVQCVAGRVTTEASGNVDLSTVAAIAATGVDLISSGALTHSVTALDISLKLRSSS